MIARHDEVIWSLTAGVQNQDDTVSRQISKDVFLNYRLLARGKSLFPKYPSSTAWEASKWTGIISELGYETIEACEGACASQRMILNNTLPKIVQDLSNLDASQTHQELIKTSTEVYSAWRAEEYFAPALQEAIKMTE
jgi:hypothetical protein